MIEPCLACKYEDDPITRDDLGPLENELVQIAVNLLQLTQEWANAGAPNKDAIFEAAEAVKDELAAAADAPFDKAYVEAARAKVDHIKAMMHKAMAEQAVTPGASAFLHPNVDLARAAETAAHAPNKNEDAHGHDVPVQYVDESGDEPDDTNADLVEIEVFDLSHEEARIYHYPTDGDDIEVEVDEPIKLYVRQGSGTHYVETVDGYGVVVPAGWYYIDVQPRHGERPFKF